MFSQSNVCSRQRLVVAAVAALSGSLLASGAALADAQYRFTAGETVPYELIVHSEMPGETLTVTSYVALHPTDVAANGEITLKVATGLEKDETVKNGQTTSWGGNNPGIVLAPVKPGDAVSGSELTIDPLGTKLRPETVGSPTHGFEGPAWQLVLPPLPPAGQQHWTSSHQVALVHTEQQNGPGMFPGMPPPPFPSPFGGGQTTRVESPAQENIDYTVLPSSVAGELTVNRTYDLASLEKNGNTPAEHMTGDGAYVFDTSTGRLKSANYTFARELNTKNMVVKILMTVTVRAIPADEAQKIATAAAKADAAQKLAHHNDADPNNLPDGTVATAICGSTTGGGPYARVDPDGRPVIGFRLELSDWGGRRCFRTFEPLYEKPTEAAKPGQTIVLARDGYVVGGVNVNASEFVNAICIIFMKKTDTGVDRHTLYASPWYGRKVGTQVTRLGGDGHLVMGTVGRQGLNMDAMGLVMAGSSDASADTAAADDPSTRPSGMDAPAR